VSHGSKDTAKDQLIRLVQSKGFGVRKSERAVKAVFDVMAEGLRRGEVVEIPGGTLSIAKNRRTRSEWKKLRKPDTTPFYKLMTMDARQAVIRFKPDPDFDEG
jgi:nucleoid DNA-binding protein